MQLAIAATGALGAGTSEDALVALARQGREDAVRELVQRHNRQLFRIARGIMRDDAEAEDVVQEAYVRAFTSLDSFHGRSSFATWLTRIAINEALGRIRRRRSSAARISGMEREDSVEDGRIVVFPGTTRIDNPEEQLGRDRVRGFLEQAVDRLPDPFRIVFILRDVEGLGVEETAAALSVGTVTVRTRLFRARRLMRKSLEKAVAGGFIDLFPFGGERCRRMGERVVERLARTR